MNKPVDVSSAHRIVTTADYPYFINKLQTRMAELRSAILATLSRSRSDLSTRIAGQVHDLKDDAFADLLADSGTAEISHELAELRDIEAAQRRIQYGTFGYCLDCGQPVSWQRFDIHPAATRCVRCQEQRERTETATRRTQDV